MSLSRRKQNVDARTKSFTPPKRDTSLSSSSALYIAAGGCEASYPIIQKILEALYPQQAIHWTLKPNFKEIDTYVIFYLCPYGIEEIPLLTQAIHNAQQLLESNQLKPEAHILIILYRDLKVAFPERKLQREKVMSEMIGDEILPQEAPRVKERIRITHEFGINNFQDSLQQLTGNHFYFEVMPPLL